jgi:hypothetical protein
VLAASRKIRGEVSLVRIGMTVAVVCAMLMLDSMVGELLQCIMEKRNMAV